MVQQTPLATAFPDAYTDARKQAAAETGLARTTFPEECGWELDGVLADWDEDTKPLSGTPNQEKTTP